MVAAQIAFTLNGRAVSADIDDELMLMNLIRDTFDITSPKNGCQPMGQCGCCAVMVDGNEYNALILKEEGKPVEVVYPAEGTPMAVGPNGVFKNAPNPNAAKLFQSYCFSAECQQLVIDVGALRSVHPQAKEHAGRKPFKDIKVMKDDPAGVEKNAAEIKARYTKIFGV